MHGSGAVRPKDAELIDEWLDSHRGKGVQCYTHGIQVAFPLEHLKAPEYAERIAAFFSQRFGGATRVDGRGYWCPRGRPCPLPAPSERVAVIYAAHHCTSEKDRRDLAALLKEAAEVTGQEALAVRGTAAFYVIGTEKLKAE